MRSLCLSQFCYRIKQGREACTALPAAVLLAPNPQRGLPRTTTQRKALCPWYNLLGASSSGVGWPLAGTMSGHAQRVAKKLWGGIVPPYQTWPGEGELEALPQQSLQDMNHVSTQCPQKRWPAFQTWQGCFSHPSLDK